MEIIGFYGPSGSGKTTLVTRLITDLTSRGIKVASVKAIHQEGFSIDTPCKDTHRHAEAGSGLVCAYSKEECSFIHRGGLDMGRVLEAMELIGRPDILIVEGARDWDHPKVMVGECDEAPGTMMRYEGDYDALLSHVISMVEG